MSSPDPASRAERVIAFIERHCRLPGATPGAKPAPFRLADWQKAFLRGLYAEGRDGRLLHTRGLLSVSKKNGKTGMMAALVLAYLAGPLNRAAGRYYSVAGGSKEQAGELFNAVADMIARNPALEARLEVNRRLVITHREKLCSFRALSTNANAIHGIIPDFWVYDEIAQAQDFAVYEALDRAQGTKPDTTGVVISTMSQVPANPMARLVRAVQEGQRNGAMGHWHCEVYQADPEGDLYDMENVRKANPSMGSFLAEDSVRREMEEAQAMASRRIAYMAYRLNLDAGIEAALFSPLDWDRCAAKVDRADLEGETCIGGLDLSSSRDLTAFALWFPARKVLICDAWLPRASVAEREEEDHAPYRVWAAEGWVHLCEGEVIDREQVLAHIMDAVARYKVQEVRYDAWRMKELEADAIRNGWTLPPMVAFRQGYVSYGPAIDELERLVIGSSLTHEDSPALNMCVRNTRAVVDPRATNAERRPGKVTPDARIDCAVAAIMACAPSKDAVPDRSADDLILAELYR